MAKEATMKKGPVPTAGYPEIEKLLDTENFEKVNATFAKAYEELSEIASKKRGLKKSREAKKVMAGIELLMNLFRELLTIKYQLKERLAGQGQSKPLK